MKTVKKSVKTIKPSYVGRRVSCRGRGNCYSLIEIEDGDPIFFRDYYGYFVYCPECHYSIKLPDDPRDLPHRGRIGG